MGKDKLAKMEADINVFPKQAMFEGNTSGKQKGGGLNNEEKKMQDEML